MTALKRFLDLIPLELSPSERGLLEVALNEAYAAGVAAERERCAGIAAQHERDCGDCADCILECNGMSLADAIRSTPQPAEWLDYRNAQYAKGCLGCEKAAGRADGTECALHGPSVWLLREAMCLSTYDDAKGMRLACTLSRNHAGDHEHCGPAGEAKWR